MIIKNIRNIIVVLFIAVSAYGQTAWKFSGYIIDLPVYQSPPETRFSPIVPDEPAYQNLTRLRLRPEIDFKKFGRINAEFEINSLYTTDISSFFIEIPPLNRQLYDLSENLISYGNLRVRYYLDRLYYKSEFDFGSITLGRQRISWGTGRIWNPTDLFNPINSANFAKIEKDGADAISTMFFLGSFTDLELVYNPADKFNVSNYGFRFRSNLEKFDFAVSGGYFDRRIVGGFDFAGNLLTAGLRGELLFSADESDTRNNFIKYILGLDYQFTPELYALAEYHYNGGGTKNKTNYDFYSLLTGKILNLNTDYLALSASLLATPLSTISATVTSNLNDGSGLVLVTGDHSLTSDLYIGAGIQKPYGPLNSEYGFYSGSYYVKFELYF